MKTLNNDKKKSRRRIGHQLMHHKIEIREAKNKSNLNSI